MSLESFNFPAVLNTSEADIIADFFVPALSASVRYDRGVGFFSAGWLRAAAEGMAAFVADSGRARWMTSPILSPKENSFAPSLPAYQDWHRNRTFGYVWLRDLKG